MKLNKTKVRFILRQYRKHASTKEISRDVKVSQRRVQQIIKQYKETGLEPVLGENIGRPVKPYDENQTARGHPALKDGVCFGPRAQVSRIPETSESSASRIYLSE